MWPTSGMAHITMSGREGEGEVCVAMVHVGSVYGCVVEVLSGFGEDTTGSSLTPGEVACYDGKQWNMGCPLKGYLGRIYYLRFGLFIISPI